MIPARNGVKPELLKPPFFVNNFASNLPPGKKVGSEPRLAWAPGLAAEGAKACRAGSGRIAAWKPDFLRV